MAMTMHVNIVSAEQEIYSGTVTQVFAPAEMGEVGVMPRHAPMLSTLKPGVVRVISQDGEEQTFFVSGGILEIQPHVVTILSDTALRAADIDESAALEAKSRAEAAMKDKASDMDYAKAKSELIEAVAQIEALKKIPASREKVAELGKQALQGKGGPAAYLIAWQAATLGYFFGRLPDVQSGYNTAKQTLKSGTTYETLMSYLNNCK